MTALVIVVRADLLADIARMRRAEAAALRKAQRAEAQQTQGTLI